MRTPVQKLIDSVGWMAQGLDADELYDYFMEEATRMLEKEKETIKKCIVMGMEFIPVDPSRYEEDSELIFNETFNTKER